MRNAKVLGILTLLIVLFLVMSVLVPESFLTANNVENLLRRTALHGILGIGVAFVIITSGIDLSIGSVVCLAGCVLALVLQVNYVPPDEQAVLQVRAATSQLVVAAPADRYHVGDRLRYYGGLRAETAVREIRGVTRESISVDEASRQVTVLTVDQPFTRDDSAGYIAQVHPVRGTDQAAGGATSLQLNGVHTLQARDRLQLVDGNSGALVKDFIVAQATIAADETRVELSGDAGGKIDTQLMAVPLVRHQRMPVLVGVSLVLALGITLGLVHGLLITKVHLQPFVVTLCGLLIYRGVSRWLVNDQNKGFGNEYDTSLMPFVKAKVMVPAMGGGDILGIPFPFFILIGVAVVASLFLGLTVWGRYMLALGRSKQAADYSGINTDRMTIVAYVICSTLAVLGGMLFALDGNSVSPSSFGNFFELYAIAAAVLGGCSLRGGEGGIFGVVVGAALMQTLNNLILLLHISDTLQSAIIGAVILIGVLVDEVLRSWARRRKGA